MFNKSPKIEGSVMFKFSGISMYNRNLVPVVTKAMKVCQLIYITRCQRIQNLIYRGTKPITLSFVV